jgi:DNA-directed RNA polymerase subunit beta
MQRQGVPCLRSDRPIVGTGYERVAAEDSGAAVVARNSGLIEIVTAQEITIKTDEGNVDVYKLMHMVQSNKSTCFTHRPVVFPGMRVLKGDVLADGACCDEGNLALGKNVLVAFMPWGGYNYEDAILISERMVKDDVYTSIHIERHETEAVDTKLGPEEITRDIPNVGEEALRNLDEAGIVAIGAEVQPGDILVGKVTPKGESPMTPEEKLLRAIFGEKASDVRDTSLRLPPGVAGTIVDVRVFNRHGVDKDERALAIERAEIDRLGKDRDDEFAILNRHISGRLRELLIGKVALSGPKGLSRGEITVEGLSQVASGMWWQIALEDEKAQIERTTGLMLNQ